MTSRRLPSGGRIDRSKPIRFVFDGREHQGFEGDTLASALLANGVDVVCASPILGRPRGVYSAGVEEPSAFVAVDAPDPDPIAAATMVELEAGLEARGAPGVGRLTSSLPRPRPCEHRHLHVELLVVGSGDEGLVAAEEAAGRGERALVVEREATLAGAEFEWEPGEVSVLIRATALGLYDDGYAIVHERSRPVERLWHVRAKQVVLATGVHQRPIAFADNDRPGVMLAGAASRYVRDFGVLPGERAVVFTTNVSAYDDAVALREAGAEVAAIIDVRSDARLSDGLTGVELLAGWTVAGTEGDPRVTAALAVGPAGVGRTLGCDLLVVSGGFSPVLQLWRAIGGGLRYDETLACFVPDGDGPPWLRVVGAAAGNLPPSMAYWYTPAEDYSQHFVDLQRDQTVADVIAAVDGGLRSVEHVKRSTYIGTAIDQGRTSGVLTAEIVNLQLGWDPGAQGPTNARPPYTPVSFAALAGPYRGRLIDPERRTPIHAWHVEHGAVFENVGQWKRPWYFPRDGESMREAVERECLAVRNGVGMMDASTLGKIEVVGADAPAFLDRMYTNAMSTLAVGRIRYGLMTGLDGMAFDDGVAMRLAQDRYLVTTTTGGAGKVLDHFEEWLQTEWPNLRVYCTSVTEQWATIAVAGPRARDVVAAAGTEVDLSVEAFPFMTFFDGLVAGMPARVARVSFSGELAYEINVAGPYGLAMWEAVMAAGEPFGLTPYGTEAMHLLRAEKGFAIVGQETDGTVTPHDLGMSWIVNETKGDFVGRRSLRRADMLRSDRKHLVGLLTEDPQAVLPEGAQIVLEDTGRIPMPMVGHVTSSYPSPVLGRSIALAMVQRGRELHGATVFAPLPEGTIAATVTDPVLYDPEGARRDG
ncbi:MAG TPA: 2Fe-2S iron-sulfur cluster-binding protein [Actinomycetota bacterium]|jgi:sarcosine oxidase subunit alpha|nr:2Fe-2S iron-sulfur cluster-binding protein [Actinomycetota bacterium]